MRTDEISVLIPTFRRPEALRGCLEALTLQRSRPAQVIVVVRPEDDESHEVAEAFDGPLALRTVSVSQPGQVQALNCGLRSVRTPLVAITDDDARPRVDWIERICEHFADPTVGAVGGRDAVYWKGQLLDGSTKLVGRVQWYGRVIGNHHLSGPAQDVQFLKGANMSYRRDALLGFDEQLAGHGAQVCNDMQASLRVHVSGWRVVWDPAVAVDHYPAERLNEDQRLTPIHARDGESAPQSDLHLALPPARLASSQRGSFRSPRGEPVCSGVVMLPVAVVRAGSLERPWFGFRANLRGRPHGLLTFIRTRGRPSIPADLTLPAHRHVIP